MSSRASAWSEVLLRVRGAPSAKFFQWRWSIFDEILWKSEKLHISDCAALSLGNEVFCPLFLRWLMWCLRRVTDVGSKLKGFFCLDCIIFHAGSFGLLLGFFYFSQFVMLVSMWLAYLTLFNE